MSATGRIDDALEHAVARQDLPMVVAMAASRDEVIYAGAFGVRTHGLADPVALDTTFRLHSMTKAITAVAALQLVARGKLALDSPAADVMPELATIRVLEGFDDEGQPSYRAPRQPITLRNLLNHTSGFSYDLWSEKTLRHQQITGLPGPFSGKRAALFQPLLADPGTEWRYSIGLDWVGQLVEAASGSDLDRYLRQHIFEPLGMVDTTFVQTEAQKQRRVAMHRRQPDGSIVPVLSERPDVTEIFLGGGGLFGTVPDFLRFTRALLRGEPELLAPEIAPLVWQNAIGDLQFAPMRTVMPAFTRDYDPWPGMRRQWSLVGLLNTEATPQGRAPGALSWGGLSNLHFWIDRARGITGVFASQMLPFADARATAVFEAFESAVYNAA